MTFGQVIRQLRIEKRLSLRELATRVGIDFTYLSKVENGKADPPSDDVINRMSWELGYDSEQLLALAAKVSKPSIRAAVVRDPRAGVLFRKLQSGNLTREQITKMLSVIEEAAPDDSSDHRK